jgi:hypothetical protein
MNAEQYVRTLEELKDYLQYKGPGGDDILKAGDPLYWLDDKYTIDFDNDGLAIAVNTETGQKINSEGEMYYGGRKKTRKNKRKTNKRKRKTNKRKRKTNKRKH